MAKGLLSLTRSTFLIVALWLGTVASAQQADTTIVRVAGEYLKDKKCKDVERLVAPLIDREAPLPAAFLVRAKCRIWYQGQPQEGMDDLKRALAFDPKNYDVLMYRGDVYNDWEMYDRSAADLDAAVEAAPDTASLVNALGRRSWNHYCTRRFKEGMADCARALAMDSTNGTALNNMALASNELGDTATAFRMLKAMIRLDPKDDVGWLNTGFFLGDIGRHQEALYYYDQAEKMGRKDARFFNNRGYSKLGVGDYKGARKDIERSIEIDPRNAYAFRNMAHLELALGRKNEACTAMERALDLGFTERWGPEVKDMRKNNCN